MWKSKSMDGTYNEINNALPAAAIKKGMGIINHCGDCHLCNIQRWQEGQSCCVGVFS